ncbi:MAG: LysM peptidoglycan-binding domain-containing protein [Bdellovibrionales bacterium]|nr:LysM peptidoglycan-binding domain-containing protein [Bdellovibrionales bacterium]
MNNMWLITISLLTLIACGPLNRSTDTNSETQVHSEIRNEDIQVQMAEIQSEYGHVDVVTNGHVQKWMKYYQGRGRKHMTRYLERSTRYLSLMREVLREEGLPEDLVYLPIVESGFSASAHSFASAVGYWQFIRSTGKRYGLRIDGYIDERRDPVESTKAAARYLKALYNLFGDWYLALASYNTGENRVKRLVMKYETRDYWQLAKRRRLPRETRDYVPKYLAALIIAKNPIKYGFQNVDYMEAFSFDSIPVFKSISLEKLAQHIGFDYKEIMRLNPMFRSDYVPVPLGQSIYIRVPKGYAQTAVAALEQSVSDAPKYVPNDIFYYRVRRGDTLSGIALRHRTSVSTLKRMNNLGRRSFIRVGQRLKVPDRGNYALRKHQRRVAFQQAQNDNGSSDYSYHVVRQGENLSLIAKKYGVSVSKLKRLNNLGRRSLLRIGQKIKIKEEEKKKEVSEESSAQLHRVNNGENLSLIANKYGVSLSDLMKWNQLNRRSILRVGQKLRVLSSNKPLVHVVGRGENLSLIAQKYQVSISEIAQENSLKNKSHIAVGRRLVIPK